jgi:hypothetical protein
VIRRVSTPSHTRTDLRALALAATLVVASAACGEDDDDSTETTAPTPAPTTTIVLTTEGTLRVRPVVSLLGIDNMPIGSFGDDDPAEDTVGSNLGSTVAYDLGPSVAEESDIVSARAEQTPAEWTVVVTLDDDAVAEVRDLATVCLAARPRCERGRIAVTVDGVVLADITILDTAIGPELTLSGGLNEQQATLIADTLDPTP